MATSVEQQDIEVSQRYAEEFVDLAKPHVAVDAGFADVSPDGNGDDVALCAWGWLNLTEDRPPSLEHRITRALIGQYITAAAAVAAERAGRLPEFISQLADKITITIDGEVVERG